MTKKDERENRDIEKQGQQNASELEKPTTRREALIRMAALGLAASLPAVFSLSGCGGGGDDGGAYSSGYSSAYSSGGYYSAYSSSYSSGYGSQYCSGYYSGYGSGYQYPYYSYYCSTRYS
ncbi:MAG: hypothetical protein AABZ10_03390 [Nitrospirota bacterium]